MMERLKESRWLYILVSVLIAVAFWLYIRNVQNTASDYTIYNVPVQITNSRVLNERGLTVASLSQDTVNVTVNAPWSVQRNLNRNNIVATVDVSTITEAGSYELACTPRLPTNVDTTDAYFPANQETQTITVTVDTLTTETMNVEVRLEGNVADGYQAGTPVADPETVTISGTPDAVARVRRVVAVLQAEDLDQSFAGSLPLVMLDADGNEITDTNATLSQDTAYVTMTVGVVKEVDLTVNLIPGGGASADNGTVTVDIQPSTITVVGTQEELSALTEISLGSIDLAQVIGTSTLTMPIELSPTLENADGVTEAQVTVTVSGLETRSFDVTNISVINVPDPYVPNLVTTTRTVVVRGSASVLDQIDASQLRIVADLSDVAGTGIRSVPAQVYLDASDEVGVIGTYTISVNITQ